MQSPLPSAELARLIDDRLPQTQCGRCGFAGCRPYAEAISKGDAIDRCSPGGGPLLEALAELTGRTMHPSGLIAEAPEPLRVARVNEAQCIGCTLCIQACPVDAIVGAPKQMHAVVAVLCTGCELCVPACPVDCIEMPLAGRAWSNEDARSARTRYTARSKRLAEAAANRQQSGTAAAAAVGDSVELAAAERRAYVSAARQRAKVRRASATAESDAHR